MTSNSKDNVENVMKFEQNHSKSYLKMKSRYNSTYKFDVETLITLFFKKVSIKNLTNDFRDSEKDLNAQIFENKFNNFATINMFFEIQQKFRMSKFTNSCLKQRFTNIIENFKSNLIRSTKKYKEKLNIIES